MVNITKMKYFYLLLTSILILSCQKNDSSEILIGTWNKCNKAGEYFEWKIDKTNILMLGIIKDDIALFENKIVNNSMIIKGLNIDLPNNIDTLVLISQTKNQITLQSNYNGQIIELRKMENTINEIDSLELDKWKRQNILSFQKRADLFNCPDQRTGNEKIIYDFGEIEFSKETETPIELPKE